MLGIHTPPHLLSTRLVDLGHEFDQIRWQLLLVLAAGAGAHETIGILQGLPPYIQRAEAEGNRGGGRKGRQ